MFSMISVFNKYIKDLFYKIIIRFIPELENLKSYFINSEKGESVLISQTFRIIDSKIGAYSYIAQDSRIQNTVIGKFCSIGPNLFCGYGIHPVNSLSSAPMFYSTKKQNGITLSNVDKIKEIETIEIGNDVFIGINVTILDGVKIGDGAVIGAGALVSKDIPPYAVAVGCPIRILKYRHSPEVIEKLLKIKWWDWDFDRLKEVEKYFDDVEGFVKKYS